MWLLVKIKEIFFRTNKPEALTNDQLPEITLFVTAYNEEDVIDMKMLNTIELDYPKEKLQVLWVTDGSTDSTPEVLRSYANVEVQHSPDRRGKTAAINRGIQFVKTSLVVFCDANTILNPRALNVIANLFADPTVGCVSGEKRIAVQDEDGISSKGESVYWRYESTLKSLDSQFYSAVGAAGELFAIRKELFEPMPEDTLLDDFILSMKIAQKGYRIAYTAEAYAVENGSLNIEEEAKRKRRICAGGWQSILRLTPLLNFFKYGRLSFMYISHRVLRWSVTPFALFLLIPFSLLLAISDVECAYLYVILFILQMVFYILAFLGYLVNRHAIRSKFLYIPYYFVFMNTNVFKGMAYLIKNKKTGVWEKSKRR